MKESQTAALFLKHREDIANAENVQAAEYAIQTMLQEMLGKQTTARKEDFYATIKAYGITLALTAIELCCKDQASK